MIDIKKKKNIFKLHFNLSLNHNGKFVYIYISLIDIYLSYVLTKKKKFF